MTASESEIRRPRVPVALLFSVAFALSAKGFYDVGASYGHYRLPQLGVTAIPELELVFYAWYGLFGALAGLAAACLFAELDLDMRLRDVVSTLCSEPRRLVLALSLLSFAGSLAFRRLVLQGQPIADDEATYTFIARTLLAGRFTNPPPLDPDYFRNQFVVLNDHAWHGKYPIGHPLWLAIGEALHARDLMAPLAGALCVALTYGIGRRLFSERRALLGASLLCVSPHFEWTNATLLSQPTGCLALLLGSWSLLRAREQDSVRWASCAGAAFGFGVLVRPLPGVLFALVAAIACALPALHADRALRLRCVWRCACFAAACTALAGCLLIVNYAQTGDAFTSGYHEYHGTVRVFANAHSEIANSLFGALLRENFWLYGVPFSLLPVLLARPRRECWIFWGCLAAELASRVISPKTVVSTTGPIYMAEAIPFLTLAAADGLARLGASAGRRWRSGPLTLMAAGLAISLAMFVPVAIEPAQRGGELRSLVYRALAASHAERALVFADALIYPQSGRSWAYYPDNPSPTLDDDILFVRIPQQDPAREVHEFWQRRFKDRRAFLFMWSPKGEPLFRELGRNESP
jgi:hypothetical protein